MSSLKEILSREFYSDISKINDLGEIPEGSEPLLINEISENLDNNILIIARDLKRYQLWVLPQHMNKSCKGSHMPKIILLKIP